MRVFHDRLTTIEDREYLKKMLAGLFKDFGFETFEEVIDVERVLFGDFVQNREA